MKIYNNKTVQQYCFIAMAVAIASFSLFLSANMDSEAVAVQPVQALTASEIEHVCSLRDVVCDNEVSEKSVVYATVTTYQAVAGQTDSTPCVGAMPGVNFCNPPYPIVAVNGYKFGTKVRIRGVVYTVSDRMNSRYGSDTFDILTDGDNYKYTNEPVEIIN